MSQEQDQVFFRNFSLVVGGIAVMMITFFFAAKLVSPDALAGEAERAEKVAELTRPVGTVVVAGEESEQPVVSTDEPAAVSTAEPATMIAAADTSAAAGKSGEEVFNGVCKNCHGMPAMAAMMPQLGDAAAWEPRIAKGIETLYSHAINGFNGMPARGGNPALGDDEVKAAVDYMVNAVQ